MRAFPLLFICGCLATTTIEARAQPAGSEPTAVGPPGAVTAPAVPAVKPGMRVRDSSGTQVGVVQSVADTPRGGVNVVAKIDGKLVGLPASSIQVQGGQVVSSQSKQAILASAGAPP